MVDREREIQIEIELAEDSEKIVPGLGNLGRGVNLTGLAFERGELDYMSNGLNIECSNKISYNRTLSDYRNPKCRQLKYDLAELPPASVIIIFYNEVFSVLVRTIHNVLNTSPPSLLREIILVDDCSTISDDKEKLEHYIVTRLPGKVKMLRLPER